MTASVTFRDATPADMGLLRRFVADLADYEKLSQELVASEADYHAALFGTPPRCYALFAERDGNAVGFAVWYASFSTFTGRAGLYVEDVFVQPAYRHHGIGRAIFRELARRAMALGFARMEWVVLDWNMPAVNFYRTLGAKPMDEWTTQRLTGDALAALAA